jgi:hypothetical protein
MSATNEYLIKKALLEKTMQTNKALAQTRLKSINEKAK